MKKPRSTRKKPGVDAASTTSVRSRKKANTQGTKIGDLVSEDVGSQMGNYEGFDGDVNDDKKKTKDGEE